MAQRTRRPSRLVGRRRQKAVVAGVPALVVDGHGAGAGRQHLAMEQVADVEVRARGKGRAKAGARWVGTIGGQLGTGLHGAEGKATAAGQVAKVAKVAKVPGKASVQTATTGVWGQAAEVVVVLATGRSAIPRRNPRQWN